MHLKFLMLFGALVVSQSSADSSAPASGQDVRSYNLGLGRWVFTQQCLNCHTEGMMGAPKFGNPADWAGRLDRGLSLLIARTLTGHGKMRPKGGFEKLTEREVAAAVAYLVDQSRRLLLQSGFSSAAKPTEKVSPEDAKGKCDPIANVERCSTKELQDALLIQMLWLLAGGES